ncbi:MAG: UDP-N-acetylmuramoyl-L-alanine--D-glutamate ligase [Bacteroidales bacterium]|nr:UDP-N-acetylmuramoyl-L-alanine--D-glutamate ligase [Bacteroidales bacterium]
MNPQPFQEFFRNKKVAVLGFAREGQSTYRAIRKVLPDFPLVVCDRQVPGKEVFPDREKDHQIKWCFGENYLDGIQGADIIIKSPGIPFRVIESETLRERVVSQTGLFLQLFRRQVVGITGTKGKSTTSSLLFHILKMAGRPVLLAGNIGIPPLDLIDEMTDETVVVFEMSSHQLEHLKVSPHMAILLNIFEEHLDHYASYRDYQLAKMNIARWQQEGEVFIYNPFNEIVAGLVAELDLASDLFLLGNAPGSSNLIFCDKGSLVLSLAGRESRIRDICRVRKLPGNHNLLNIAAASAAAYMLKVAPLQITRAVASFDGLPHRLEFVGFYRGISFYNDSISTIPESTIEALKTFPGTSTLLLGGFDRGVNYSSLINFLAESKVQNLIFIGKAGQRMYEEGRDLPGIKGKNCLFPENFEQAVEMAMTNTLAAGICLLSPAAASYDTFRNFEHRGNTFKDLVRKFGSSSK